MKMPLGCESLRKTRRRLAHPPSTKSTLQVLFVLAEDVGRCSVRNIVRPLLINQCGMVVIMIRPVKYDRFIHKGYGNSKVTKNP